MEPQKKGRVPQLSESETEWNEGIGFGLNADQCGITWGKKVQSYVQGINKLKIYRFAYSINWTYFRLKITFVHPF